LDTQLTQVQKLRYNILFLFILNILIHIIQIFILFGKIFESYNNLGFIQLDQLENTKYINYNFIFEFYYFKELQKVINKIFWSLNFIRVRLEFKNNPLIFWVIFITFYLRLKIWLTLRLISTICIATTLFLTVTILWTFYYVLFFINFIRNVSLLFISLFILLINKILWNFFVWTTIKINIRIII
jgi:hypothetical protein